MSKMKKYIEAIFFAKKHVDGFWDRRFYLAAVLVLARHDDELNQREIKMISKWCTELEEEAAFHEE